MPYREEWEEVSFQVINEMDGSVRSGYFPTGEGIVTGNIAVDREWGNFPMQPNDDRSSSKLSANDSHSIALTEWNSFPKFSSSANYMVTGFEFLGDVLYECTSQNNLKEGDEVVISNIGWYEGPITRTVVYADANRFQFLDEAGYPPKLTGLYGRVDVRLNEAGRQLEGKDNAALFPAIGACNTNWHSENALSTVAKELIAIGCPPEWMTDAKFEGGENEYDWENGTLTENSGVIFWTYVAPEDLFGPDANGKMLYGSDFDNIVVTSVAPPNAEISLNPPIKPNFAIIVFQSHSPNLNTAGWLNL